MVLVGKVLVMESLHSDLQREQVNLVGLWWHILSIRRGVSKTRLTLRGVELDRVFLMKDGLVELIGNPKVRDGHLKRDLGCLYRSSPPPTLG